MPRPTREAVMNALFTALTAALQIRFSADTQVNSPVLNNPTTTAGMLVGMPVFGAGIPSGAVIQLLSPLTLSLPAEANALQVSMNAGVQTVGRRLIPWGKVKAQPALFLRDGDEHLDYSNIVLQRQTMFAEIWLYSNAGEDPDAVPAVMLNVLLEAVQSAFAPDQPMMQMFTLGGLVEWCRLAGKVEKEPGDLDGQAIAVAEVEITVP